MKTSANEQTRVLNYFAIAIFLNPNRAICPMSPSFPEAVFALDSVYRQKNVPKCTTFVKSHSVLLISNFFCLAKLSLPLLLWLLMCANRVQNRRQVLMTPRCNTFGYFTLFILLNFMGTVIILRTKLHNTYTPLLIASSLLARLNVMMSNGRRVYWSLDIKLSN